MALQIDGINVVDNNRYLSQIEAFSSLVKSIYYYVTASTTSPYTLENRVFLFAAGNNMQVNLPTPTAAGNQCVVAITDATGVVVDPGASNRIQGLALGETLALDVANITVTFTYVDGTRGWIVS